MPAPGQQLGLIPSCSCICHEEKATFFYPEKNFSGQIIYIDIHFCSAAWLSGHFLTTDHEVLGSFPL